MRKYLIKYVLLFSVLGFARVESKEERKRVDHHIAIEAQLVYLRRAKIDDRCLARVDDATAFLPINPFEPILPGPCGCPGTCVLDTQDLVKDMWFDPGLRATMWIMPHQDWSLEGRYLGFFSWKGTKTVSCTAGLNFLFEPNNTEDWIRATAARAIYDTSLWNAEFNYWRHVTPRRVNYFSVSWLAGLRYLEIDEDFKVSYRTESRVSDYRIKTRNHVAGAQIGGNFEANPYRQVIWGVTGRLGLMANYGDQVSRLSDINNTVTLRSFNPSGWNFAWLGEIAPFFTMYFFPMLYLKLSYEVLFIENLVLAPNQIGYSDSGSGLNSNGRVLYHGAYAGLGIEF